MTITIGSQVTLKVSVSYLKTTDPMPMLRPGDLVSLDEVGEVVGIRPFDMVEVKFRLGTFLIPSSNLSNKSKNINTHS